MTYRKCLIAGSPLARAHTELIKDPILRSQHEHIDQLCKFLLLCPLPSNSSLVSYLG